MSLDKRAIVRKFAHEHPQAPSRTLARVIVKAEPKLFSFNSACCMLRRLRGSHGKRNRKFHQTDPLLAVANGKFESFPVGQVSQKWEIHKYPGPMRVLILSDVHIPFHDSALHVAVKAGREFNADTILLNGDIIDAYAVSRWENDPRKRDFPNELKLTRLFLETLRKDFPKARIIYKFGNHEERWEHYMKRQAPELLGCDEFQLASLLHLDKHGVECIQHKHLIQLGDLNVIHGHEYRFAISNPVNPARGLFLRAKTYAVCGHFHQSSYHTEKTLEQSIIATWSTGCLCELNPEYLPLNNHCHGFALVEVQKSGRFTMQNKVIRDGVVY